MKYNVWTYGLILNDEDEFSEYPGIDDNNPPVYMEDEGYYVANYAWTDNKKFICAFEDSHRLDKFVINNITFNDINDFEKFSNQYAASELVLSTFKTSYVDNNTIEVANISILTTVKEADIVRFTPNDYVQDKLEILTVDKNFDINKLNKEYQFILNKFLFGNIIIPDIINPYEYIRLESFDFDELMYYIKLFKNILKG